MNETTSEVWDESHYRDGRIRLAASVHCGRDLNYPWRGRMSEIVSAC
jgi:hypothetical protein